MSSLGGPKSGSARHENAGSSGCASGRLRLPAGASTQPIIPYRHPSSRPRAAVSDGVYDGDDDNTDLDINVTKLAKSRNEFKTKREPKTLQSTAFVKEKHEDEVPSYSTYENALEYLPEPLRSKRRAALLAARLGVAQLRENANTRTLRSRQDIGGGSPEVATSVAVKTPLNRPTIVSSQMLVSLEDEQEAKMKIPGRYPSSSPSLSASPTPPPAPPPTRIVSPETSRSPTPLPSATKNGKSSSNLLAGSSAEKIEKRVSGLSGSTTLLNQTLASAAATVAGRASCDPQTCERYEKHHGIKYRFGGSAVPCDCGSPDSTGLKAPAKSTASPDTSKPPQRQFRKLTTEMIKNMFALDEISENNPTVGRPQQPTMPGPFMKSAGVASESAASVEEEIQMMLAGLRRKKPVAKATPLPPLPRSQSPPTPKRLSKKMFEMDFREYRKQHQNFRQKCEEQEKFVVAAEPMVGDDVAMPHKVNLGAKSSAPSKRNTAITEEKGKEPYKKDIPNKTNQSSTIAPNSSKAMIDKEEAKNSETSRSGSVSGVAQARETAAAAVVDSPKELADPAAPLAKNIVVTAQASGLIEGIAGAAVGGGATDVAQSNTSVQKTLQTKSTTVPFDTKLDEFEEVNIATDGEQELADWDVVQNWDGDETWVEDEPDWKWKEEQAPLETDGEWLKFPTEEVV